VSFLLDTHVISELRKGRRANAKVRSWFRAVDDRTLYLSVLVIGELRKSVEELRGRDPLAASRLEQWLHELVQRHTDRILWVDAAVADRWGQLSIPGPISVMGGLLAATALVHGLTLVTHDIREFERTGVVYIDPFV
jgi:predicted nucleic acid-binding protein